MSSRSKPPKRATVPLTLPPELHGRIKSAASETGLAQADVMRLSIDRGLSVLLVQLGKTKPAA